MEQQIWSLWAVDMQCVVFKETARKSNGWEHWIFFCYCSLSMFFFNWDIIDIPLFYILTSHVVCGSWLFCITMNTQVGQLYNFRSLDSYVVPLHWNFNLCFPNDQQHAQLFTCLSDLHSSICLLWWSNSSNLLPTFCMSLFFDYCILSILHAIWIQVFVFLIFNVFIWIQLINV